MVRWAACVVNVPITWNWKVQLTFKHWPQVFRSIPWSCKGVKTCMLSQNARWDQSEQTDATHHFITKMERECHLATLNQLDIQVAWLSLHYAYVFGFFLNWIYFAVICWFVFSDDEQPREELQQKPQACNLNAAWWRSINHFSSKSARIAAIGQYLILQGQFWKV